MWNIVLHFYHSDRRNKVWVERDIMFALHLVLGTLSLLILKQINVLGGAMWDLTLINGASRNLLWSYLQTQQNISTFILIKTSNMILKTFKQVLKNTWDIPLSQFPTPCFKGNAIAIRIPKDEYVNGLDNCKNFFHGGTMLKKREYSPTINTLHES